MCGAITMAVAPRAPSSLTRSSSTCSAENWIERSSVSTRSSPGIGASVDGLGSGDRPVPGRDLAGHLSAGTAEHVVVLHLEAGDAGAVDVGLADHAASGLATGHFAPVLPIDVDAGQLEARDLVAERGVDLAGDVHESALLAVDLGLQFGDLLVGQVEQVVERLDRGGAVVDEFRVDRDGGGGHRDRQLVAVAVEDGAALRGHVPRAGPLRRALLAVRLGFGGLQRGDTGDDHQQQRGDDDQRGDQPESRRPRTTRGALAWRRRLHPRPVARGMLAGGRSSAGLRAGLVGLRGRLVRRRTRLSGFDPALSGFAGERVERVRGGTERVGPLAWRRTVGAADAVGADGFVVRVFGADPADAARPDPVARTVPCVRYAPTRSLTAGPLSGRRSYRSRRRSHRFRRRARRSWRCGWRAPGPRRP